MPKDDSIQNLTPQARLAVDKPRQILPDGERSGIKNLMDKMPTQGNLWKLLIRLTASQAKFTFGKKHKVVIVGPANVGKSTLYNQLIMSKDDLAQVSPIPGTTREVKEAAGGLFSIIDTPGADAAGPQGEEERNKALVAAACADFLIIIFDASQGIKKAEQDLFLQLSQLGKPYVVVLNKIDLIRRDEQQIKAHSAAVLGLNPAEILPISAKDATNLSNVLVTIAAAEPEIMAALGAALPQYRWHLARRLILGASSLSGVIALTPLPFIDFIPLVINQSTMVLGIARIYQYRLNLRRAREIIFTFGFGFLARSLFYELSKLGGIPGWILSAAIAASSTLVMGYAVMLWFDRGEKLSTKRIKELSKKIANSIFQALKPGKKRRSRKEIRSQILKTIDEVVQNDVRPEEIDL